MVQVYCTLYYLNPPCVLYNLLPALPCVLYNVLPALPCVLYNVLPALRCVLYNLLPALPCVLDALLAVPGLPRAVMAGDSLGWGLGKGAGVGARTFFQVKVNGACACAVALPVWGVLGRVLVLGAMGRGV